MNQAADPSALSRRLQEYMLAEVPVARAMQVRVAALESRRIRLTAPLAVNDNHKGTAFGGSQYALAALAGWGLLVATLWREKLPGEIVIRDGEIRYDAPVRGDLDLVCEPAEAGAMDRFLDAYRRHHLARIALAGSIAGPNGPAMRFNGNYVAGA